MNSPDPELVFRHPTSSVRRAPLREFLAELQSRIARGRSMVCLVTDDRELRLLNRRFRGKNSATDVLSFPSSSTRTKEYLGELAISLDRAREQAAEQGHTLDQELRILMLHGALHLAGFDHENDQGEMARTETRWRKRLGLPNGLLERSRS